MSPVHFSPAVEQVVPVSHRLLVQLLLQHSESALQASPDEVQTLDVSQVPLTQLKLQHLLAVVQLSPSRAHPPVPERQRSVPVPSSAQRPEQHVAPEVQTSPAGSQVPSVTEHCPLALQMPLQQSLLWVQEFPLLRHEAQLPPSHTPLQQSASTEHVVPSLTQLVHSLMLGSQVPLQQSELKVQPLVSEHL